MTAPGAERMQQVTEKYNAVAAAYDQRWARYLEETISRAVSWIEGPPTGILLDVPCGTGSLLQQLTVRWPTATLLGVDGASGMLAQARAKFPAGRIPCIRGSADALPMHRASVEWITCTSALHYFQHPAAVLREFHRVLTAHGRLLLLDWCRETWQARLINRWLRITDRTHVRTYTTQELRDMLTQHGFRVQRMERFRVPWSFPWRRWDMMMSLATPLP